MTHRMVLVTAVLTALATAPRGAVHAAAVTPPPRPDPAASTPVGRPGSPAGIATLDQALRFATSVRSDAKDRAQAEEEVVLDYAALGALDEAAARAEQVEGWRRGAVLADIARRMAAAGRPDDARALIGQATAVRMVTEGWQGPRIDAHIAQARALLGDAEADRTARALAESDPRQYAGRSAASLALGMAVRGDMAAALAELGRLDGVEDFDVAWWRTAGYMEISRLDRLPLEERVRALESARRSAAGIAGWKRAEALIDIAAEARRLGKGDAAREMLSEAEAMVQAQPATLAVKADLMSRAARGLAASGEEERARALLRGAEEAVPAAMLIECPGLYASVAEGWAGAGDRPQAARLFDRALASAGSLQNARPRALAVVATLRAMGRAGLAPDAATNERLDALYAGLKDPW